MVELPIIIAAIVMVFILVIGGYYIYLNLAGPRKIDDIEKLMKQNRLKEAIAELEKVLEKDERNMRAHYRLAQCYARTNRHNQGIVHLRQCLKFARYTPEITEVAVRSLLAEGFEKANNLTEAKNEFLILTTLDSENFEPFYKVGELFFRSGMHQKAVQYLAKATKLNARHAESLALLGQCLYHQQSYQEAKEALSRATQLKSDHYVARYFLGLTLRYLGDLEWAIREFDKAEKDEAIKDKVLLAKGLALIDQENYPRAMTELDRALRFVKPGSDTLVQAHYLLALAAEKSRDLPTAISHWEKCEAIKPGFRDVRDKLKQYAEFRTDDAIKDFMIASNAQFEGITRSMLENMGYQISSLKLNGDTTIEVLALDGDQGKRAMRKQATLFLIQRDINAVHENLVRNFHEQMRELNAARGIIMTTGDIAPGALSFASTRPIDLYDAQKMAELLKS